ncbi:MULTISPECIES: MaoC family dehydratase [Nocardia]|uniref:MaoC family dehydratase n=1 Tax=Nocardia abscessus TaxID=120957 RepID=UPI0018956D6A|nr:MaoC family dehydratase [Nocardia abscessus]MBF6476088.1 MaoC family dehydratase [Nocardia abscessus]
MRVFATLDELTAAVGDVVGITNWLTITQQQIDRFAEATGDHQWIHTDPQRAARGPFGATIAHGYLTLSLIPYFSERLFSMEGARMGVNYGTGKVRFPAPVPVGSRLRDRAELLDVSELPDGARLTMRHTIEIEGALKPACVAETLALVVL